jgi:3-methyladenine DNA glycosylase/8-oxoguanine DNA glycosylase
MTARGDVGFGSHGRRAHYRYAPETAVRHLRRRDARMGALIRRVGPFALRSRAHLTPFQALLRAIVYQQLSGLAAASIDRRLKALFPGRRPSARRLIELDDEALRGAGLSRSKVASARDLAAKALSGELPSRRVLESMDDDAIIERLVAIRGIGRWTVEMLLIFSLGRPDVLPVADLGVRKGFMLHRGHDDLPDAATLTDEAEPWRPYRSVASWYLWRACELPW